MSREKNFSGEGEEFNLTLSSFPCLSEDGTEPFNSRRPNSLPLFVATQESTASLLTQKTVSRLVDDPWFYETLVSRDLPSKVSKPSSSIESGETNDVI